MGPDQSVRIVTIVQQIDAFKNFNAKRVIVDSLLPHALCGFSKENKQYFIREFLQIIHSYSTTSLAVLYDLDIHQALWLDTSIVSDQLLFNRHSELDYITYWLEVSKNNHSNQSGKYRFTFNAEKGIELKHRLC